MKDYWIIAGDAKDSKALIEEHVSNWEEGQKFSPEVFHKLGDFLFNKELKLAQDFSEWALDSYKPFGEPIKSFDWEKYLNKKICEVIHEIH